MPRAFSADERATIDGRIRAAGTIVELRSLASRGSRYTVETDAGKAEAVLTEMRGVARVEALGSDGRWARLAVTGDDDALDLREPIFRALTERGGAVRELHSEAPSLEHLFLEMLAEAEADFARREGGRDGAAA